MYQSTALAVAISSLSSLAYAQIQGGQPITLSLPYTPAANAPGTSIYNYPACAVRISPSLTVALCCTPLTPHPSTTTSLTPACLPPASLRFLQLRDRALPPTPRSRRHILHLQRQTPQPRCRVRSCQLQRRRLREDAAIGRRHLHARLCIESEFSGGGVGGDCERNGGGDLFDAE